MPRNVWAAGELECVILARYSERRHNRWTIIARRRRTILTFFTLIDAELIEENYFHAALEATKGLAERIRALSGLTSDGADLREPIPEGFLVTRIAHGIHGTIDKHDQVVSDIMLVLCFGKCVVQPLPFRHFR